MRINKLSRLLLVFIITALIVSLVSCKNGKGETNDTTAQSFAERTEYTVTFVSNGGSSVAPITVYKNSSLTPFTPPTRDDYVFVGWTCEGREWVFGEGGDLVKSDITLYANWAKLNSIFQYEERDGEVTLTKLINATDYKSLTIPETFKGMAVTGIGDEVFKNFSVNLDDNLDKGLRSISFPKSVTKIGTSAFEDCTNLVISFDGALSEIGENAFYGCNTLTEIKLSDKLQKIPFRAFSECVAISYIDIPDGVKVIDEDAFAGCSSLSAVVLPATLSSIENAAFDGCSSLKTIFFAGSEEQFDKISVATLNDAILDATIYFYSEQKPAESGAFWHYDQNNSPVIW